MPWRLWCCCGVPGGDNERQPIESLKSMILYKYLSPERLDILSRQRIRFTQPAALNDPFELRPYFTSLFPDRYLQEQISGKTLDLGPLIDKAYEQLPEGLRLSMSRYDLAVLMKQIVESDEGKQKIQELIAGALVAFTDTARQFTPKAREQMIQTIGSQVGILSLSEVADSILMSSHYGGSTPRVFSRVRFEPSIL